MNTRQKLTPELERQPSPEKSKMVKLKPINYDHLIGMPGFSEKLLTTHFKLYQGYVSNTNTMFEELDSLSQQGKDHSPQFAEMKRRLGWEFNGARLHEFYFGNLGGLNKLDRQTSVGELISQSFGTVEAWKNDFLAAGAMRGIGWVVLYFDPPTKRLFNLWIEEHNANHLAGGLPLLVMDVFEHAFMIDYGSDRIKYLDAFLKNIDWKVVNDRCERSKSFASATW